MKSCFVALTLLVGSSAQAQSLIITDARVEIWYSEAPVTFSAENVGWSFPITLNAGQDLVLTQNTGTYAFDTSDAGCQFSANIAACNTGWALIRLTVNGVEHVFWDLNRVLTLNGHDPLDPANEAQELSPVYQARDFDVYVGYADNIHTDPCGSYPNSVGLFGAVACLPSPFEHIFDSDRPTYFQGQGVPLQAGLTQTQPNHCVYMNPFHQCYDAGVIRIVAHSDLAPLTPGRAIH